MMTPNAQPDLSICIVNWNARDHLRRCLRSLESEGSYDPRDAGSPGEEVIVVDNASTDGSAAMVAAEFPWAILLSNRANIGFARANNEGMRRSHGRYVLLLNPDTIVHPGSLRTLVEFMDRHPETGACGPKLLNPDGSLQHSCRAYPGIGAGIFRNTLLGRIFPRNRFTRHYMMSDYAHHTPRAVDWLSGACLMVRREVMEQVGLLDEDYFMYCEDVDWCYRMEQRGWQKVYVPQAIVTHVIGASSDQKIPAMIVAHHRSMIRFYFKHYFFGWRILLMPALLSGIVIRCTSALFKYFFARAKQL